MNRMPRVTARRMLAALQRAGFVVIRSKVAIAFSSIEPTQRAEL
jgi:DNA-binding IclR family transcriptional regulator